MNIQLTFDTYGGMKFEELTGFVASALEKGAPNDAMISTDGDQIVVEWDE